MPSDFGLLGALTSVIPCVLRRSPLRAIEGGRITFEALSSRSTSCRRSPSAISRRVSCTRSTSRLVGARAIRARGRATPVRIDDAPARPATCRLAASFATGLHQVDNPVFDREGNCTSPTAARAASRCRCRSSASRRTARASRSAPASSTRRRWRSGRTAALRVEPLRGHGVSRRTPTARTSASPPISASRAASRSTPTGACSSAIAPARSSASRRHGDAFATLPPSVAAFHLAWSRRARCTSPRRRWRRTTRCIESIATGEVRIAADAVRPAAGIAFSSGQASCTSSKRWPAASGLYRLPLDGEPELVVSAPASSASPSILPAAGRRRRTTPPTGST